MDVGFIFDTSKCELNVSERSFCETVAETKKCCKEIQRCIKDINDIVCDSAEYWKTSSGRLLRDRFSEETLTEEFSQSCIVELVRCLEVIIDDYRDAYDDNSKIVALADDILG